MRVIIATAAVAAVYLVALDSGLAQTWSQTTKYNRCNELASRQGLNVRSTNGRRFMARCMQRAPVGPSRNCPDDPRARSAYPAWMCP